MTTYKLTVTASPALRARAVPGGSPSIADFFKYGDKLTAADKVLNGSMYWYRITECLRNGLPVALPYVDTWAGAGAVGEYLRVDSVVETPTEPPVPAPPVFPLSFVLTDPQGNKAQYTFVKVIE